MNDLKIREEEITKALLKKLKEYVCFTLEEPDNTIDYTNFKFDLILKSKKDKKVCALVEAKYRSGTDRPVTDALAASFWKLLWEWGETYCFDPNINLAFLVYYYENKLKPPQEFRNSIFEKFNCFIRKHCNRQITTKFISVKVIIKNKDIEFDSKQIEDLKNRFEEMCSKK